MSEGERPGPPGGAGAPPLDETLRTIAEAGKASLGATRDSLRALRALVSADLALARSALGRGIAWAGVGMVLATLVTLLIPGMQNLALMLVAIVLGGGVAHFALLRLHGPARHPPPAQPHGPVRRVRRRARRRPQ